MDGCGVGFALVGAGVELLDGVTVGAGVELFDGVMVGAGVEALVGATVGATLGATVVLFPTWSSVVLGASARRNDDRLPDCWWSAAASAMVAEAPATVIAKQHNN